MDSRDITGITIFDGKENHLANFWIHYSEYYNALICKVNCNAQWALLDANYQLIDGNMTANLLNVCISTLDELLKNAENG